MKKNKIKQLLIACIILIQFIWYGLLVGKMITQPEIYKPTDFSIFYTAGRIADTGHYDLIYNLETQRTTRENFLGFPIQTFQVLPFNHPPIFVPVLKLLVDENYMSSYWRWAAILLLFSALSILLIIKIVQREYLPTDSLWLLILTCLLFYPLFVSIFRGQDSVIVLLGLLIWMYGLVTKKDPLAGAGLGLVLLRPQIALILAIPFIFNRRKVWWWFCGIASLLVIFCFILVGWNGAKDFITLIGISAAANGFEIHQQAMLNFTGMAIRFFPNANINIIHASAWGMFLAALVGLCIWWKHSQEIGYRQIVGAVIIGIFVAPHLHYHDLSLLLVPIFGVGVVAMRTHGWSVVDLSLLLSLISITLLLSIAWNPLLYSIPYIWMAALLWAAWRINVVKHSS
jgi:hypothetical protein